MPFLSQRTSPEGTLENILDYERQHQRTPISFRVPVRLFADLFHQVYGRRIAPSPPNTPGEMYWQGIPVTIWAGGYARVNTVERTGRTINRTFFVQHVWCRRHGRVPRPAEGEANA